MSTEWAVDSRENGIVVKWFPERGYGFVKGESGTDYWFHKTWLNDVWSPDQVRGGQVVTFIRNHGTKGWEALDVRREDRAAGQARVDEQVEARQMPEPEPLVTSLSQEPPTHSAQDEGDGDAGGRLDIGGRLDVGLQRVRILASDQRLRVVIAAFRELSADETEITVDDLHRRVLIGGFDLRRGDVIAALRALESADQGTFVPGRWGHPSRFEGCRALRNLGEAVGQSTA